MPTLKVKFELREETASVWSAKNSILNSGEPGYEKDTKKFKMGDGVSSWNDLPYYIDEDEIAARIQQAIEEAVLEGVDLGHEFVQSTPSASWSFAVPVAMNRRPTVTIYDDTGNMVFADVDATPTTVNITFPSPITGSAVLS